MTRRLDAAELSDAAMSAALAMGLLTTGRLLAAGTAFQILATIVMAVLGARRRLRVVAVATAATMALAVLLGGIGPITQAFFAGVFGYAAGIGLRHRVRLVPHVGLSLAIGWPVVSALSVGFLAVFSDLRRLTLDNVRNQGHGIAEAIERARLDSVASGIERFVDWSVDNWYLAVPIAQGLLAIAYALVVRRIGRAILDRVDAALRHRSRQFSNRLDLARVDRVGHRRIPNRLADIAQHGVQSMGSSMDLGRLLWPNRHHACALM